MNQSDILLGLQSDPFVTSVLIGMVWPFIQAALDRPYWTRERRVWLTIAVAVVVILPGDMEAHRLAGHRIPRCRMDGIPDPLEDPNRRREHH